MAPRTPRPGLDLNDLLRYVMEQRASDLHIKVGSPPFVRIDGHLQQTPFDVVNGADTERMAFAIMPKDRADEFITHSEALACEDQNSKKRSLSSIWRYSSLAQRSPVSR